MTTVRGHIITDRMLEYHTMRFDLGFGSEFMQSINVSEIMARVPMMQTLVRNKKAFLGLENRPRIPLRRVMVSGPMVVSSHKKGRKIVHIFGERHGIKGDGDCAAVDDGESMDIDLYLAKLFIETVRRIKVLCEMPKESSCLRRQAPQETSPYYLQKTRELLRTCPHGEACVLGDPTYLGLVHQQPKVCHAIEVIAVDARVRSDGRPLSLLPMLETHRKEAQAAIEAGDVRALYNAVTNVMRSIDDSPLKQYRLPSVQRATDAALSSGVYAQHDITEQVMNKRISGTLLEIAVEHGGIAGSDAEARSVRAYIAHAIDVAVGKIRFVQNVRRVHRFRTLFRPEEITAGMTITDDLRTVIDVTISAIVHLEEGIFWANVVLCDAAFLANLFCSPNINTPATAGDPLVETFFVIAGNSHAEFIRGYLAGNGFSTDFNVTHEPGLQRCINLAQWQPTPSLDELIAEITAGGKTRPPPSMWSADGAVRTLGVMATVALAGLIQSL